MKDRIRINALAKELGAESRDILAKLNAEELMDVRTRQPFRNHMATLTVGQAETVRMWAAEGVFEISPPAVRSEEIRNGAIAQPIPHHNALGTGISEAQVSSIRSLQRSSEPPRTQLPLHVYEGDLPYAFVSYKREDFPRIHPFLEALQRAGVHLWYDAGIPGGAEWDAVLARKIKRCQLVLLFLTSAAIGSRYVRREIKYADREGKRIVPVRLEAITLSDDLDMMLSEYQFVDATVSDSIPRFLRAVDFARGTVQG